MAQNKQIIELDEITTSEDDDALVVYDLTASTTVRHTKENLLKEVYVAIDEAEGSIERDVTSMLDVGGIASQELLAQGMSLTEFVEALLLTTFYPTFVLPTFSLTHNQSNNLEAGTVSSILLTYNFNRGSILGALDSGVWNPLLVQDFRAGAATKYIIDGQDKGTGNTHTLTDYEIEDGANSWVGNVAYAIGPQPTDSDGQDYNSPYPAGNVNRTATVTGRRNLFYGYSNDALDSDDIRDLQESQLNPANGTEFTINIPIGATNVVFAYPATLRDVSSVKYVEGMYAEIKDVFDLTTFEVEGANGYLPINYKVYVFTPVEPFSAVATYNVTI